MKTFRFVLLALFVGVSFAARAFGDVGATQAAPTAAPWVNEVMFWGGLLLPTIITGLTRYRQFGWVSTLLDLLSIVKHKDSPGTLALPFTLSRPPAESTDAAKTVQP